MKTTNVTVFQCDQCGKKETRKGYVSLDEWPSTWIRPSGFNSDFSTPELNGTMTVVWDDKHFCSRECVIEYFSEQFKKAYQEQLESMVDDSSEEAAA